MLRLLAVDRPHVQRNVTAGSEAEESDPSARRRQLQQVLEAGPDGAVDDHVETFRHLLPEHGRPVRVTVVGGTGHAHLAHAPGLVIGSAGGVDLGAERQCKLHGEQRHAATDARDQDPLARLRLRTGTHCAKGRDAGERKRRGMDPVQVTRLARQLHRRHVDGLGESPVPRRSERKEVRSGPVLALAPGQAGVDDDFAPDEALVHAIADRGDRTRAVRARNYRVLQHVVSAFLDPDIAVIHCRAAQRDGDFARGGRLVGQVHASQGLARAAQQHGLHQARAPLVQRATTSSLGVAPDATDWACAGVREKRGAGAGCRTPPTSTNVLRCAL